MSINKTIIQGRLTKDVELRSTQSGKPVCGFTVAWSEKVKESEQKVFMPCVAWNAQAEFISKYFSKGQECVVEGKLVSRQWQDKNGNNRETIELIADRVHFCGPKQERAGGNGYVGDPMARLAVMPGDNEDLPFN